MTYSYSQISHISDLPAAISSPVSSTVGRRKSNVPPCYLGRALRAKPWPGAVSARRSGGSPVRAVERVQAAGRGLSGCVKTCRDSMLQQGVHLLARFVQDGRVRITRPKTQQQIQFTRTLSSGASFVSYVDAIGELDATPRACWSGRPPPPDIPEEPAGITGLDPQLICYSWMTGIG